MPGPEPTNLSSGTVRPDPLLRWAAIAEASTLLFLLFVAVPAKHLFGYPQVSSVAGSVHGFVFLTFCWVVFRSWSAGELPPRAVVRMLIGAVLPFGGFVNERWLARQAAKPGAGA